MKILLITGRILEGLYAYFDRERWSNIDFITFCQGPEGKRRGSSEIQKIW